MARAGDWRRSAAVAMLRAILILVAWLLAGQRQVEAAIGS